MTIDEFSKVELRVGHIDEAERVEGSEKLIRMQVNVGDRSETGEAISRQILAGIGKSYAPEDLVGRNIVVVANLEPRSLMGFESQGMLLAATEEGGLPVFLTPDKDVRAGTRIG